MMRKKVKSTIIAQFFFFYLIYFLAASKNVETINNDYCLFLQHGQSNQICNYKRSTTECFLNCEGPFCVTAQVPFGIVAKLSDACWLEQTQELLNQNFGKSETRRKYYIDFISSINIFFLFLNLYII